MPFHGRLQSADWWPERKLSCGSRAVPIIGPASGFDCNQYWGWGGREKRGVNVKKRPEIETAKIFKTMKVTLYRRGTKYLCHLSCKIVPGQDSESQLFQALMLCLLITPFCYLLTSFIALVITPFWGRKHAAFSYCLSGSFTNLWQKWKYIEADYGLADLSSVEKLLCTKLVCNNSIFLLNMQVF